MNFTPLIAPLEAAIGDPCQGLPEEVFLFVSRVTPMINVDLLIQDEACPPHLLETQTQYARSLSC